MPRPAGSSGEPALWAYLRRCYDALRGILTGKLNCTTTVTLTPGSTTTALSDPRIGPASFIGFMPLTAHAATAKGGLHVSAWAEGQGVLTHASTADSDKSFDVLIIGRSMAAPPRGLFDILSQQRPEVGPPRGYISGGLSANDAAVSAPPPSPQDMDPLRYLDYWARRKVDEEGDAGTPALRKAVGWRMENDSALQNRRQEQHLEQSALPRDNVDIEARFGDNFCIAENGMMSCRLPGQNFITQPFPQGDLPDRISLGDPNARFYRKSTEAPTMEGLIQALINNPTPGDHDRPATAGGTNNNALPPYDEWTLPFGSSPVTSYVMKDPASGETYIVNVTRGDHPLYPGVVIRRLKPAGRGAGIIDTYGVGTGVFQGPGVPFNNYYARSWPILDKEIIDTLPTRRSLL